MKLQRIVSGLATTLVGGVCAAQGTAHRPPAVPLIANDPYFSVWSMADKLTGQPTKHWTEAQQPMIGLLRVDGKTYRWMGEQPRRRGSVDIAVMDQTSVEVTPLHSRYVFKGAGVELHATFFTPSFPQDLDVLSRPVTYLTWSVVSTDGASHQTDLLLDVSPLMAVNDRGQKVTWGRFHTGGMDVLRVGSRDQEALNQSGDRIRIDWGYFNLAVPASAGVRTQMSADAMGQFASTGQLSGDDDLGMPAAAQSSGHSAAHLAASIPFGSVGGTPVEKHVLLAYTDGYSIEYLGRKLHGYWQRNGMTDAALLSASESDYASLEQHGVDFDKKLIADLTRVGGADYAYLGSLLFRHTLAAHKLVADVDGTPMLFSKENDSNGCIDTVDVTYPSSPFFLLFNPQLLKAQLEPLMRYAAMPRWRFPFAPHDLGTYPLANGQVYGGGEVNEDNQMPVEESGNLLLMIAALGRSEGNYDFAKKYMPVLTKWAAYLAANGLDPENQLSTDDFAGHLAHNANLSIKAIEALGGFVQIAQGVGDNELAKKYEKIVKPMPAQWEKLARDGDHYVLAFGQPGTWSQKYNLVWDDVLNLHLFPKSVAETEWAYYTRQVQPYGLPLDNRKTYTKLDWEVWTAAMAPKSAQSEDLIHRLAVWADATPSRVPTTDWYDTITGKEEHFQARSVVGGVFIKALLNPEVASHWKSATPTR